MNISSHSCKPHLRGDMPSVSVSPFSSQTVHPRGFAKNALQSRRKVLQSIVRLPRASRSIHSSQVSAYHGYTYPTNQTQGVEYAQERPIWRNDYHQHYIHGKLLGAGSFGNVHLGIHRSSGIEVAVKIMRKKRGNLSRERTISRIMKEVSMMEALQGCPNVVRLYGCFDDEEEAQLVMEYCSGGDLQHTLNVGARLSEYDLAVVAYEVLKIIKACHDKDILHGDVKPANFVFSRPRGYMQPLTYGVNWLRAIDFGCSQYLPYGERLGRRVGTPAYMAPEVFARDAGMEADMWSLGVMLYQLYTGRFPFWEGRIQPGVTGVEDVMEAVMHSPLMIDGTTFPTLTTEGKDFIIQCLQRDIDDRITADEALQHPWFCNMFCQSNIVPTGTHFATARGCVQVC